VAKDDSLDLTVDDSGPWTYTKSGWKQAVKILKIDGYQINLRLSMKKKKRTTLGWVVDGEKTPRWAAVGVWKCVTPLPL
jgi:hypothetical protein